MSRNLKRKNSTRQKLSRRVVFAIVIFSTTALVTGGWLVYLNMLNWESSRAAGNGNASGGSGYAGEVLCEYAWEQEPGKATVGPDAITIKQVVLYYFRRPCLHPWLIGGQQGTGYKYGVAVASLV
jgi:hypothetical protein